MNFKGYLKDHWFFSPLSVSINFMEKHRIRFVYWKLKEYLFLTNYSIKIWETYKNCIFLQISRTLLVSIIIFFPWPRMDRLVRSISKSIDIHPFIERIYLYVRARVDPPPPSIVPKCRKISSERRCLTNVHSWPMLTHDCGSCVKERACPCRCTRVNSKLEAKGEEGGVGAAWKGGWNRWFIAKVCGIDGTNSLHTDTRAPRLPPHLFPIR